MTCSKATCSSRCWTPRARSAWTEVEAVFSEETQSLTRFANNTIHQNVSERARQLSVRPVIDGRTARATTNRLDREGIRGVVAEAVAITRLTEPDAEPAAAGGAVALERESTATSTAPRTPRPAIARGRWRRPLARWRREGQTAAGIYSTDESRFALFNSRGVASSYRETMARFSITAMAGDSSGWAKASACDLRALDPAALARRAARKAAESQRPARIAGRALHRDPGARRGARSGGADVHGFQRHRHTRRAQFPERPHGREGLRRQHHRP